MDSGEVVRAVILSFGDGQRDFILSGERTILDQYALHRVAAFCLAVEEMPDFVQVLSADSAAVSGVAGLLDSDFSPTMEWGSEGLEVGQGTLEFPIDARVAPEYWLSALGWVLSQFYRKASPAVAALREGRPSSPEVHIGSAGYRLINLPSDGGTDIAGVLDQSRARLQDAPFYTDELLSLLSTRCDRQVEVSIGVLFPLSIALDRTTVSSAQYVPCGSAIFPITLTVGANGGETLTCHFDREIYSASSVEWLLHCLVHVCGQLARPGVGRLADLVLLSDERGREIADLGRGTPQAAAVPCRIEEAFQQVRAEQPDAIALSFGADMLTYSQLEVLSNRVANVLVARGVIPGSFVGICLNRSAPVVVVMLATLKCGAVYVPMDPSYPRDRLEYTAGDAGLKLTIAEDNGFPGVPGMACVTVADLIASAGEYPETPPSVP
ncbi:MAG: AMP-binding protein, partial [Lysobacter sp.]|nr:AMP-binding protein [Lysobacter sp.]